MGETVGGDIPQYYVWVFTDYNNNGDRWPGDDMTRDNTNAGWYYLNLAHNKTAINAEDKSTKTIRPGETLMIFNSGANGAHRHRCSHHLDPGIQLFDYEDREGWVLYDPLCAPYYRVYDERPEIVNATYDVYTQKKMTHWEICYGVARYENSNIDTYKIKCSNTVGSQVTVDGVTMYHYPSVFKAPAGDLAKNIVYYFEDGTSTTIFGGENFATSDDTARGYCYWKDNKWTWSRTPMHVEQPAMRRVYLYNANPYLSNPRLYYWNEGDTPVAWPGIAMQQYNGSSTWYCVDIPLKYMNFILCNGETKLTGDCTFNNSDPTITITSKGQIIDDRP